MTGERIGRCYGSRQLASFIQEPNMKTSIPTVSPLRQRMVEDMHMRKLAPKTQAAYVLAVRKFAKFLGHSPDTALDEDLFPFKTTTYSG